MKIVRVQYTVKDTYVSRNQENIRAIVAALQTLAHPGIQYSCYLLEDGKTFMHLDHFADEAAHLALQELDVFKKFATELWASEMEVEPVLELPSLVASTQILF